MKKPGFIIDELHREAWESLHDEQCGQLLKILIKYQFDREVPAQMPPALRMAFHFLRPVADKQKSDYEAKCEKARGAAQKRWSDADECERIRPNTKVTNRSE